mmetsp:Transcript_35021/g.100571  ORF Transcript_35021/g.100571 Transcript_35021/m.100571 type:complete len:304 (+) Transcript_35021:509-1420(+)
MSATRSTAKPGHLVHSSSKIVLSFGPQRKKASAPLARRSCARWSSRLRTASSSGVMQSTSAKLGSARHLSRVCTGSASLTPWPAVSRTASSNGVSPLKFAQFTLACASMSASAATATSSHVPSTGGAKMQRCSSAWPSSSRASRMSSTASMLASLSLMSGARWACTASCSSRAAFDSARRRRSCAGPGSGAGSALRARRSRGAAFVINCAADCCDIFCLSFLLVPGPSTIFAGSAAGVPDSSSVLAAGTSTGLGSLGAGFFVDVFGVSTTGTFAGSTVNSTAGSASGSAANSAVGSAAGSLGD